MKKMLFYGVVALVFANNIAVFAQSRVKMAPGPARTPSRVKMGPGPVVGSMPPAPQPGFYDLTSASFQNLKPADKNFEVLKELYDIALNLKESFAELNLQQHGTKVQELKVSDIQPLLLDIRAAIDDLAPAIITLKGTLLNLKPQDVNDFRRLNKKALDLKPADEALQLSTPALSIQTPGQKAMEQKRINALKNARNKLRGTILP